MRKLPLGIPVLAAALVVFASRGGRSAGARLRDLS